MEHFSNADIATGWLLSLIRDPEGSRYFQPRTKSDYEQRFLEGLARIEAFCAFLGQPERQFDAVHIAGTSGKGSVTTMIAALLTACGKRTGDHISPYLQTPREKLRVDGVMISSAEFISLLSTFKTLHDDWLARGGDLRYGEAWVALTFYWFAQKQLDWGVMETGMGGRLDLTNILPSRLAVITNVDYDHVNSLGPSLAEIAWHKVGIIKQGCPVVSAETKPEVLAIIKKEAADKAAPLHLVDWHDGGDHISVTTSFHQFGNLHLGLDAAYQRLNAATAITAVSILAHEDGFDFTQAHIERALHGLVFAGRMETMQQKPRVIIDGAHNPHKMRTLVADLKATYPNKRIVAIVGMILGKSAEGIIDALAPICAHIIATQPVVFGKPSRSADSLSQIIHQLYPALPVTQAPDVFDAFDQALKITTENDVIVITGSLYLIGQAREKWHPIKEGNN